MDRFTEHLNERRAQRYASTRLWIPDPNEPGMNGELRNALEFGAEPDQRNRPAGDRGIDLEVLLRFGHLPVDWCVIDAKASNTGYLLVDVEKIKSQYIYILYEIWNNYEPNGWETGSEMMRQPHEVWLPGDKDVYYKRAGTLRPMSILHKAYCGWWRHHGLRARPARKV